MKILYLGMGRMKDWYFYPLLQGFQRIGNDLQTFVVSECVNLEADFVKFIEEYKPDMIFSIGIWFRYFNPVIWDVLKRYSIPHVYWAIEDSTYFEDISLVHVKEYDFVLTISKKCIAEYAKLGVKAAYIPHTIDPDMHKVVQINPDMQSDLIVTGNSFSMSGSPETNFRWHSFNIVMDPIIRNGYDVKVYGTHWYRLNLPNKCLAGYYRDILGIQQIYSGAKIVLGIQRNYDGHICFRTFEALSYGRLLISPYTPVQEEFFTHEKHLLYVRSAEETKEYVDYYLAHPDKRTELALAGQAEVHKNHNCQVRAQHAVNALKSSGII